MEMYGYTFIRESDLMHHGIKGQKWGQRRFQNDDGTWTAAGKERYGGGEGQKKLTRAEKKSIRKEYRQAQRARNKELANINEKFDKKGSENAFGLDSGGVGDRLKGHLKNEYERSQAINKWDQKNLDAKRQYRVAMGKKKTDTLLMKWQQESINDISKQSQSDFNRDYVKHLVSQAYEKVNSVASNASSYGSPTVRKSIKK